MPTFMRILSKIGSNEPSFFALELLPDELINIGRVVAQWGYLEHFLLAATDHLCSQVKTHLPKEAQGDSFNKRVKVWRKLVNTHLKNGPEKANFINLANQIEALAVLRHRVIHGLWDWSNRKKGKKPLAVWTPRESREFIWRVDKDDIFNVARQIGQINARFLMLAPYLLAPTPTKLQRTRRKS